MKLNKKKKIGLVQIIIFFFLNKFIFQFDSEYFFSGFPLQL